MKRVAGSAAVADVSEQRVYHLTHVSNLHGILSSGSIAAGHVPTVDISPAGAREERESVEIPGIVSIPELAGAKLADFVPFFVSPNALVWQSIRAGEAHPRVSREIKDADAADFVLLVSTIKQLVELDGSLIVTDGAAEGDATRFGVGRKDAETLLRKLRSGADPDALLDAEVFVHGSVPLESVSLIGVAHDKARAVVRQVLVDADAEAKVAVYPPWFAAE